MNDTVKDEVLNRVAALIYEIDNVDIVDFYSCLGINIDENELECVNDALITLSRKLSALRDLDTKNVDEFA